MRHLHTMRARVIEALNLGDKHQRYFTRLGGQFAEDMPLYSERFRVVERIEGAGAG
jgi:hypothetical protein